MARIKWRIMSIKKKLEFFREEFCHHRSSPDCPWHWLFISVMGSVTTVKREAERESEKEKKGSRTIQCVVLRHVVCFPSFAFDLLNKMKMNDDQEKPSVHRCSLSRKDSTTERERGKKKLLIDFRFDFLHFSVRSSTRDMSGRFLISLIVLGAEQWRNGIGFSQKNDRVTGWRSRAPERDAKREREFFATEMSILLESHCIVSWAFSIRLEHLMENSAGERKREREKKFFSSLQRKGKQ